MKKIIFLLVIVGLLAAGSFVFYLVSQKDESKAAEIIAEDNTQVEPTLSSDSLVVKNGRFNYLDPLHYGEGEVKVHDLGDRYKISLGSSFKSADAPDPYIYLSSTQEFKDRAVNGVDTSKTINLGKLKNFTGEQDYFVSKKDFDEHNAAIIIWCKKFGIQISRADLK